MFGELGKAMLTAYRKQHFHFSINFAPLRNNYQK